MRTLTASFAVAVSLLMVAGLAEGQKKSSSDAQYIAEALSAAPKPIAKNASVVRIEKDGSMTTLRPGKNGFSCMITANNRMCADANSMEFFQAWAKHQSPPDKLGSFLHLIRFRTNSFRRRCRTYRNHRVLIRCPSPHHRRH